MNSIFPKAPDSPRSLADELAEDQMRRDIHRVVRSNAPHCYEFLCAMLGDCPPEPSPPTPVESSLRDDP